MAIESLSGDRKTFGAKVTGAQVRAARALVGWSAQKLADTSGVGIATIWRAEKDDGPVRMIPANLDAITRTLEAAGVEFTNGGQPGVRKKAQP